jgi:hypothetical protein
MYLKVIFWTNLENNCALAKKLKYSINKLCFLVFFQMFLLKSQKVILKHLSVSDGAGFQE